MKGEHWKTLALIVSGILIISFTSVANPLKCSYKNWNIDSIATNNMVPDQVSKSIPDSIYVQTSIALSFFPELKDLKIVFRFTKSGAPLETMPSFWSIFKKPQNREYNIWISTNTATLFEPILFKNLSFDAQIGVLAHELSHVSDFQHFKFWNFIVHAIKYTLNSDYGDAFEYNTDMICIKHGAGYPLLVWSTDTRTKLDIKLISEKYNFDLTRERYMHPESIKKAIKNLSIYNSLSPSELCY